MKSILCALLFSLYLIAGENTSDPNKLATVGKFYGGTIQFFGGAGLFAASYSEAESSFSRLAEAHENLKRLKGAPRAEDLVEQAKKLEGLAKDFSTDPVLGSQLTGKASRLREKAQALIKKDGAAHVFDHTYQLEQKILKAEEEVARRTDELNRALRTAVPGNLSGKKFMLRWVGRGLAIYMMWNGGRQIYDAITIDAQAEAPDELGLPHAAEKAPAPSTASTHSDRARENLK